MAEQRAYRKYRHDVRVSPRGTVALRGGGHIAYGRVRRIGANSVEFGVVPLSFVGS